MPRSYLLTDTFYFQLFFFNIEFMTIIIEAENGLSIIINSRKIVWNRNCR